MLAHALLSGLVLAVAGQTASMSTSTGVRGEVPVLPFPTGEVETINIIQWDANALPKIYQRSDQLPLTDEDLTKLAKAGFKAPQLVKMIEERRCACDASADGLIKLKEAGVPDEVLQAVSLHGLRPNRSIFLDITLDFAAYKPSNQIRDSFLYVFVEDGEVTRVLTTNLADLLANPREHDSMVDRSDILRSKNVRRIRLPGELPLKNYGKHRVLIATSPNPSLTHPEQLSEQDRQKAQLYTFDYPRSSLQSVCRLNAGYQRDAVLAYKWRFSGSRFECEWN
jgi:hypothetical protein